MQGWEHYLRLGFGLGFHTWSHLGWEEEPLKCHLSPALPVSHLGSLPTLTGSSQMVRQVEHQKWMEVILVGSVLTEIKHLNLNEGDGEPGQLRLYFHNVNSCRRRLMAPV